MAGAARPCRSPLVKGMIMAKKDQSRQKTSSPEQAQKAAPKKDAGKQTPAKTRQDKGARPAGPEGGTSASTVM